MVDLPKRKYNIIYADPPWNYQNQGVSGSAERHYSTMSLEDIKKLPIQTIADNPCALLCWVTFPLLKEGLEVIDAWGFEYKTLAFSWVKTNSPTKFVPPFQGMGNYTRSNCEVCLLGVKGNVSKMVRSHKVSSLVIATVRKHSQKPDLIRQKIVQLFGDVPRIELFARQKAYGWDVWGDEVEDLPTIEEYTL